MSCDTTPEELEKKPEGIALDDKWHYPDDKMPIPGRDCIVRGYNRKGKIQLDEAVYIETLGWLCTEGRVVYISEWRYKMVGERVHPS